MLTRTEITEKLKNILLFADADNEKAAALSEEMTLYTDLGLTSVSMLYLVIAVEEEFGIRFDDVGVGDFTTVADVVTYIEGKLQ